MSKPEQKLIRFDWAMKNLLRDKANFDVLEGFLTSLLKEKITIENLLESESNKDDKDQKSNRVDLKCRDSQGRQIIIEIQSQRQADYFERIAWGASKALIESVKVSEDYFKIAKVISVSILFHELYYPELNDDYLYYGRNDIKGCHSGKPLLTKHGVTDKLVRSGDILPEFYIISVKNFDNEVRDLIDEWVYMFKNEQTKDDFRSPGIESAEKKLDYLSMSHEERQKYDAFLFNASNTASEFATARDDGRAEGRAEGKAEGLAEGELKAKLETARKMLADGVAIEDVARWTGLSVKELSCQV